MTTTDTSYSNADEAQLTALTKAFAEAADALAHHLADRENDVEGATALRAMADSYEHAMTGDCVAPDRTIVRLDEEYPREQRRGLDATCMLLGYAKGTQVARRRGPFTLVD